MSIDRAKVFRFGVFELDPRARELRKQGVRIHLQVQPFQVLTLLLERAGDVVTREELRQALWPSSVFVDFDHGLNNAIARVRDALGDAATTPHFVETIPRLGYRFIYPLGEAEVPEVAVAAPGSDPAHEARASIARASPWKKARLTWTAGLLSAVVLLGVSAMWVERRLASPPASAVANAETPSIAVLPFASMDSDPDAERFADGLSEEIVNRLAAIQGLKVVARTSSFYFKGKHDSLATIARTLNVNHVLEGSVRRSGERLRITAQLVDARDGSDRWAQTFDRDLTDIFRIQEEIALAVASALSVKLVGTDEQHVRKRGTRDTEAYRLYLIANAHARGISVKRDLTTAKTGFEQAIARDAGFAEAYGGLARYYFHGAWNSLEDVEAGVVLGTAAAERAVALDPESSEALQARANFEMWRYRFRGDLQAFAQAHADYRRAIQFDPTNETALFDYGRAVLWHEPDLAQSLFERLVEIEPLARPAWGMSATALNHRGLNDAARKRLHELDDPTDRQSGGGMAIYQAGVDTYTGHLDDAVVGTRRAMARGGLEIPVWLWGLHMSLGASDAAHDALGFGATPLAGLLSQAARLTMEGRNLEAFELLDSHRGEFPQSHVLDLPTARFALIVGKPERALPIIAERLPDLLSGVEPINGQNVIPGLDLAAAWAATGDGRRARSLLSRVAAFLDSPSAPRLAMFVYLRARTYALAGDVQPALHALDRAYDGGFRTTWALDLHPQPILYLDSIEVDPAFSALWSAPQFARWLARIREDNARQLARLRSYDAPRSHD